MSRNYQQGSVPDATGRTFKELEGEEPKAKVLEHTPGPWTFRRDGNQPAYAIIGDNRSLAWGAFDAHGEANAALIAAAPTLLSVLLSAVLHAEASIDSEETPWLDAARDALAKARGVVE